MVLALNNFDNKTEFSINIQNTENTKERYHVNPNTKVYSYMWLAQVSDGSKGVSIEVIFPSGPIFQLLFMWDFDWKLRYIKDGHSQTDVINVNSNKDFNITLDSQNLIFECIGGSFSGNESEVFWRNWNLDLLISKKRNVPCDLPELRTRTNFSKLYSVGWLPYLGDWKNAVLKGSSFFKYHDPAEVNGVGIILGNFNGKIYGDNLKEEKCEEIVQYSKEEGHYSWVFEPKNCNIMYVWNSKLQIENKNYIRHSELNRGEPVICAGEFYIHKGVLY